jgi:hypothetical protein
MATHTNYTEERVVTERLLEPAGWRLSWGAVLAGVIVALVAHILLNILGIGVGAVTAEPANAPDSNSIQNVSLVAAIWWAVSGIIAAGLGGWFAGRSMGSADKDDGGIHGLLSWAATTLVVAFFLTSVLGGALAGAMGQLDLRQLSPQLAQNLPNAQNPSNATRDPAQAAAEAAKQTTPEQRETARKAVASTALASFVALALGAIAAYFAGGWGVSSARKALQDD